MESHWNILGKGKNLTFSEQQLVDCATDFKNHGCNGGLPSQAFEYIRYHGLELSSTYPYVAATHPCRHNVTHNVAYIKYGSYNVTANNEAEVADRLATKGPISVTFHVTATFRNYAGGVYSVRNCPSTSRDVNHAVLATGYGT
jgi:cathepsin H